MADDSAEDKTEDASGKKLDEARNKGQTVNSMEVKSFFVLLGALLMMQMFMPAAAIESNNFFAALLDQSAVYPVNQRSLEGLGTHILNFLLANFLVPFLFMAAFAIAGSMLQTGPMIANDVLKFDLTRLSIFKGIKRVFSARAISELIKGVSKMIVVGMVVYFIIKPTLDHAEEYITISMMDMAILVYDYSIKVMSSVVICLAFFGGLDYFFQWRSFNKKMKMSKHEVKEENKQSEGDPLIKGKMRQLRMQKARQRMMQAIPTADVVITNPTHYAIALKYDPENGGAPICVAKGLDNLALKIRELAEEHKVPLVSNPPLARALYKTVEIDDQIPIDHYKAVAEIISFVFRLRGKKIA